MKQNSSPTLDKYIILEEIGKGGFATVFRARDTDLEREVALKVLNPLLMRDPVWVRRFRQEAKAVARLEHPHIVTIYEVGQSEGTLFIAMQLADGGTLADHIRQVGALPWDEVLRLTGDIAQALDFAHQQGVLHRDLKPSNILFDQHAGILLTDFGFARIVAADNSLSMSLSAASGSIVGTPAYIAPEIWDGQTATPQTDVYSLACIVSEMLTAQVLFAGPTPMQTMRAHDKGAQLPAQWPPGVPDGVTEVLARALAPEPSQRFSNAGDLVRALAALGEAKAARLVQEAEEAQRAEAARLAELERQRQAEAKAKQAAIQRQQREAEQARLAELEQQKRAAEAALAAERARIEAEKREEERQGAWWRSPLLWAGAIVVAIIAIFLIWMMNNQNERNASATAVAIAAATKTAQVTPTEEPIIVVPTDTPLLPTTNTPVSTSTPSPTVFSTPTIVPPSVTPTISVMETFMDNFNDNNANGWIPAKGSWNVVDGRFICVDKRSDSIAFNGDDHWGDHAITASVKPFVGEVDVGVIGRLQDAKHFYLAQLWEGNARVVKRDGSYQELASIPYTSDLGIWYDIKLEFSGTRLKMYVNDTLLITVDDATFLHGKIGLRCASRSQVYFDDVTVISLPD